MTARAPIAPGVPRSKCLPVDRLPAELRAKSEDLLKALDAHALSTLTGGLKAMSSVGTTFTFPVDHAHGGLIEERRRLLSVWR